MSNNVEHPSHYNREGSMECIDEMILIFGVEAVKNFCLCNAWKYRYRAADKNGAEDLAKSDWYIRKYNELSGAPLIIKENAKQKLLENFRKNSWTVNGKSELIIEGGENE